MRWERLFEDLEDQLACEWEAERAGLAEETERLRLARLPLRERLSALSSSEGDAAVSMLLPGGAAVRGTVTGVGADVVVMDAEGLSDAAIVRLEAIIGVVADPAALAASSRGADIVPDPLAGRLTFGFVLRDAARRRRGVRVLTTCGECLTGTVDRVGADHLDLALHEWGAVRRATAVTGVRLVPFVAITAVMWAAPASAQWR
ncbi:hypothetical protein M4I32_09665 [Microbacterium sp. LRZ72]|uniref:hypothetical protein n=1 Tax=Microbacterium sp. LRZ72 TaxID=2942481 RepID=UPI0029A8B5E1|nr:hypothetical protein [Microbacterium sp. LRZ72]MDX2377065.1 hypothetical protein [Microbacterium sp. LRZ72]